MFTSFIIILLGAPNNVGSVRDGLNAMLKTMESEMVSLRLEKKLEMNATYLNQHLEFPIIYTFPPGIKCLTVTTDDSRFAQIMRKVLYRGVQAPTFLNTPDDNDKSCLGNIVLARDISSLVKLEDKLKRDAKFRMMCLVATSTEIEIEHILESAFYTFGDSEFTIFSWNMDEVFYRVGQPVRIPEKVPMTEVGRTGDSIKIWPTNDKITENFFGRTIKITTSNCAGFSRVGAIKPDGSSDFFIGSDAALVKEISAKLNLTYRFVQPAEGERISKYINGTWIGGLYETLVTGQADMVACGSWLDRSKYAGGLVPSVPISPICVSYLVRAPEKLNSLFLAFLPFHFTTWILIAGSQVLFSGFIRAFTETMNFIGYRCETADSYRSFPYTLFVLYSMLVNGNWPKPEVKSGPVRHLFTWWVVFCVLISSCYSSNLISRLTKPDYTKIPHSLEDLVQSGYFWIAEAHFPSSRLWDLSDPIYKTWAIDRFKKVDLSEKFRILFNNSKAAIVGRKLDDNLFIPFFSEVPSNLTDKYEMIDSCVAFVFHGFIHRAGSPFIDSIDFYIARLNEAGLAEYYSKKALFLDEIPDPVYLNSVAKNMCRGACHSNSLTLEMLVGVFIFLFLGWFIALMAFTIELLLKQRS